MFRRSLPCATEAIYRLGDPLRRTCGGHDGCETSANERRASQPCLPSCSSMMTSITHGPSNSPWRALVIMSYSQKMVATRSKKRDTATLSLLSRTGRCRRWTAPNYAAASGVNRCFPTFPSSFFQRWISRSRRLFIVLHSFENPRRSNIFCRPSITLLPVACLFNRRCAVARKAYRLAGVRSIRAAGLEGSGIMRRQSPRYCRAERVAPRVPRWHSASRASAVARYLPPLSCGQDTAEAAS